MFRPKFRRTLRLERLESREVLSAPGGPSPLAQETLELINHARTNPTDMASLITQDATKDANVMATLDHYSLNLDAIKADLAGYKAQPALAWNDTLAASATQQSQYQAANGIQTHQGPGEDDLGTRMDKAGYTNRASGGENAYAYSTSAEQAMEAFLIDWGVDDHGHRNNLLQPGVSPEDSYRDVGIGIVSGTGAVGPLVLTQDFGSQSGEKAQLLGVAYGDPNHTHLYSAGEGRGDVTVDVTEIADAQGHAVSNAPTKSVDTWASGGYQIPLDPGTYQVTGRVGNNVIRTQNVTIGSTNVKVDYDTSDPWQAKDDNSSNQGNAAQNLAAPTAPTVNLARNWDTSWKSSWVKYPAKF